MGPACMNLGRMPPPSPRPTAAPGARILRMAEPEPREPEAEEGVPPPQGLRVEQRAFSVGRYQVSRVTLGGGGFGVAKKAVDAATGERLCCKMAKPGAEDGPAQRREIEVQASLRHPNVVEMRDLVIHRERGRAKLCIMLEMMEGGELFEAVLAEDGLSEDRARQLFRGVGVITAPRISSPRPALPRPTPLDR
jgi:hypothetical protein